MHVLIAGGGAVGRLFGYFLAKGHHEVTILDTDAAIVAALNARGIEHLDIGETDPDAVSVAPVRAIGDIAEISTCDLILLTVKSSATARAVSVIHHLVSPARPLLSLQTGLENLNILDRTLPRNSFLAGFPSMSVVALGSVKVRCGGLGVTYLGEVDGCSSQRLSDVARLLEGCGLAVRCVPDIQGRLWGKVIVHSAINPVSALLRVTTGCLTERDESKQLLQNLIREGAQVASACGVMPVPQNLWEELIACCNQGARNLSPMLQDILNELPTEIDEQNGVICRLGREKGVATPTHDALVQLIKLVEHWKPGSERRC